MLPSPKKSPGFNMPIVACLPFFATPFRSRGWCCRSNRRLARNRFRSATQSDPCTFSVATAIMITTSNSPVQQRQAAFRQSRQDASHFHTLQPMKPGHRAQNPVNERYADFSPTTGGFSGLPTTRSLSASAIRLRAADSSGAHLLDCADERLHLSSQNHAILAFVFLPRERGHVRMNGCRRRVPSIRSKKAIAPQG